MVHDDVLRIVQVAGECHHVGAGEFVCAVDGLIFPVCPEDSILEIRQKVLLHELKKKKNFHSSPQSLLTKGLVENMCEKWG